MNIDYVRFPAVRGHATTLGCYKDNGEVIDNSNPRSCIKCEVTVRSQAPDPCLGYLKGVKFACCGHGVIGNSYVILESGETLRYEEALLWMRKAEQWSVNEMTTEIELLLQKAETQVDMSTESSSHVILDCMEKVDFLLHEIEKKRTLNETEVEYACRALRFCDDITNHRL